jgi:HAD superfamily hydrolase (TIGR01509 family)
MTALKAILFDVDGTLADTEEHHRVAFNETFASFGLDWHWSVDTYRRLLSVSGGRERMLAYASEPGVSMPPTDNLPALVAEVHRAKTARFGAFLETGRVGLRPGVTRLLGQARAESIRLGIATSTAYSNVRALLNANLPPHWPDWFDVLVSADHISTKKPSPAVYRHALLKLGLRPDACVAIEDTRNGLRAARGAGLRTVITTNHYTEHETFAGAALVVDHLGEPALPCRARHGHDVALVDLAVLRAVLADGLADGLAERRPAVACRYGQLGTG